MDDYGNLEALSRGCVSGRISEWPMLRVEARIAIAELTRLRAELDAEKEAVRVLGEEVYGWRVRWSKYQVSGEPMTQPFLLIVTTDTNPIAAAAGKETP